ncbi:hypothetical protein T440DRAFT_468995 [Plenodomus tracheiphilus IPT5]|uniref:Uncharacterized protein n=1 Tax=Plenodomus tracheiphilus IPT5 TaxID=1408161 RepID=A0A6A7B356_9PLEO|nr:hypothetical protein T440DRAFT_468995 [Plenodomus tracheiphilus IPT5]
MAFQTQTEIQVVFPEACKTNAKACTYFRRLGFRASMKNFGVKGRPSFSLDQLEAFYKNLSEATRESFRHFDRISAIRETLLDQTSLIHTRVETLLQDFGPEIWNASFAKRAFATDNVGYPRHLLFGDPADETIIRRNIYGWIIWRASGLVFAARQGISNSSPELEINEIDGSSTMDTPLRSSYTSRRRNRSRHADGPEESEQQDYDNHQQHPRGAHTSTVQIDDQNAPSITSSPGPRPTEIIYRAQTAPMYPSDFRNNHEEPQSPPSREPQFARKTHTPRVLLPEAEEDSDTILHLNLWRMAKPSSSRARNGVVNATVPPVALPEKRKRTSESSNTFNGLRAIAQDEGIKRHCSSTGPSKSSTIAPDACMIPQSNYSDHHEATDDSDLPIELRENSPDSVIEQTTLPLARASEDATAARRGSASRNASTSLQAPVSQTAQGPLISPRHVTPPQEVATLPVVAPTQNATPPSEQSRPTEELQRDQKLLASRLYKVLMSGSPEAHDIAELEDAVNFVEAVSLTDAQRLRQAYGVASEQCQKVLRSWLICINALISFRQITKFSGDKSTRLAFLAGLDSEVRTEALQSLIHPCALLLESPLAEFSTNLTWVFWNLAPWEKKGLNMEDMGRLTMRLNGRLLEWFDDE